jgi:hypothetical protein
MCRVFKVRDSGSGGQGTMRFSDGVLEVVIIVLTSALCASCTGTWLN